MSRVAIIVTAASIVAAACGSPAAGPAASDRASEEYRDDRIIDIYEPPNPAVDAPVVVMLHGCCGDRRDLAGLSRALAAQGAIVLSPDLHALQHGGGWPTTYVDAVCAVAWARDYADRTSPDAPLAVLGWGDGALVGSAISLGWATIGRTAGDCDPPSTTAGPNLMIGVSGHYGWFGDVPEHLETEAVEEWFGGSATDRPDAWTHGNPGWWAAQADVERTTQFVLVGTLNDRNTERFAVRLRDHAVPVELTLFEDARHGDLIQPRGPFGERALAVMTQALGL